MANKKKRKPSGKPAPKGPPQKAGVPAPPSKKPSAPPKAKPAASTRPKPGGTRRGSASRRRRPWNTGAQLLIGGVVAVVALIVFVFLTQDSQDDAELAGASPGSIDRLASLPAATLEAIGTPEPPRNVNGLPAGTPAVIEDGKPVVLYYGAEFCPFCAVQRWAATVALTRFGTFEGLEASTSAPPPEILPNTPTVTFHGATYTSDYITLSSVETQTRNFRPLGTPTDEQQRLFSTYNVESVTGSEGGIPFMMIGNLYAWAGSQYDPAVLEDKTFDEIVAALEDPETELAREVGGAANYLTAMICRLTDGQPGDVCSTPVIQQARAALAPA